MTLGDKQRLFTQNIGNLIEFAYAQGFALTFGTAYRTTPENAAVGGILQSLHLVRLAVDFNLFKDRVYMVASEAHRPLGEYWKSLHPLNRWGGDFAKPDGNHYSMEHEGVR